MSWNTTPLSQHDTICSADLLLAFACVFVLANSDLRAGHWDVFVSVSDQPILSCGVRMCKLTRSRARAFALTRAYRDKFSCANSENPKHNVDCRRDSPHCTQQWLRRGPGCMAAHNETYQKPIVETSDPSISDDSKTPVASDFLS